MKMCRIMIDERRNFMLTDEQAAIFQRKYFRLLRLVEKQSFENNDMIRENFLIEMDDEVKKWKLKSHEILTEKLNLQGINSQHQTNELTKDEKDPDE